MKIALIFIFLLYLAANAYVFHRIWTAMPPITMLRIALITIAAILISSFILGSLIGDYLPTPLTSALYLIGTSWFFIIIYLVLIFLIQDLILFANRYIDFIPEGVFGQFSRQNWITTLFTLVFVSLLMVGGYLKYNNKQRVYIPIELSKPFADSTIVQPLKVVAISDLHLGYTIGKSELEGWIELINKENPDLVLIAGDIIDSSILPVEEENMAEAFKKLKTTKGVYACLGNHEYISGIAQKSGHPGFYDQAGIKLLRDEAIEIDSSLYIVGRDDKANKKRKELPELINKLDKTKPIILLDHQPYNLHQAEESGVDLQISGHTHQGQVWPISLITRMIYEKDHGYLQKGDTHIYVSSGIGLWGGKFRIGTQSEYVIFEIKAKQ